jgi:hypothetical protein
MDAAGPYEGAVAPHWPAVASAVAADLFAGERIDFEGVLRRASEPLNAD